MPSKKPKLHFYADECIPLQSITYLREKGINAIDVYSRNLQNKSDHFQFRYSKKIEKIFLSLDKDVQKFEESSLKDHPGVILIKVSIVSPKTVNQIADKILKHLTEDFVKSSVVRISNHLILREKDGKITKKKI